jgi:hypothetical protein
VERVTYDDLEKNLLAGSHADGMYEGWEGLNVVVGVEWLKVVLDAGRSSFKEY